MIILSSMLRDFGRDREASVATPLDGEGEGADRAREFPVSLARPVGADADS